MARRIRSLVCASCFVVVLGTATAIAQESWTGQTFLTDYSKLQATQTNEGRDYFYLAPDVDKRVAKFTKVMLDQPEVFIAAESPYKGAKPEDLAAIAGAVRSTAAAALKERGYQVVDAPGADTAYARIAVTDLQIKKKKRGLLGYTPVGFVVSAGVKALQDFMDKYDILDMALQLEVQDSVQHDVLGAAVLKRGKSADATKPISFDALVGVTNEYSERFACRLDNAHVEAAQRINCLDPATRKARPLVVSR